MGRIYSVAFEDVTVSAGQDLMELAPASNKPIELLGICLSQNTDVGDAADEMLRIKVIRGHTSSGTGGSSYTPVPVGSTANAAAGCAAEINNTTIASGGTTKDLFAHAFNIRAGMEHYFPPECRPGASAGDTTLVIRLMAAPADAVDMSGTIFFEEFG